MTKNYSHAGRKGAVKVVKAARDPVMTILKRGEKPVAPLLYDLLTQATPHGSESLVYKFMPKGGEIDEKGNVLYRVGKPSEHHTMFSSHMDTVQRGVEKRQLVISDSKFVFAQTLDGKASVLGADDKLGMYIMISMMKKKVPGLYVFHVGEECGGIGSKWLAKNKPEYFEHIDRCIAFDRVDYTSVITHQMGRCCSDEFGRSLAAELNKSMPPKSQFVLDTTGVFTDSESYVGLIAECTNLSVGYFRQHSTSEHFDPVWLEEIFLPACLKADWQKLETVRTPAERYRYTPPASNYYGGGNFGRGGNAMDPWAPVSLYTPEDRLPPLPLSEYLPEKLDEIILKGLRKRMFNMTGEAFLEEVLELMQERDTLTIDKESLEMKVRQLEEDLIVATQWYGGM